MSDRNLRSYYAEVDLHAPLGDLPVGTDALEMSDHLMEAFDFVARYGGLDVDFAHDADRDALTVCLSGVRAATAITAAHQAVGVVDRALLAKGLDNEAWAAYFHRLRASSMPIVRVERRFIASPANENTTTEEKS